MEVSWTVNRIFEHWRTPPSLMIRITMRMSRVRLLFWTGNTRGKMVKEIGSSLVDAGVVEAIHRS